MIPYLRIKTLKKHTLSDSPSAPPKLTKYFLFNGGNVTDGMTPGFKQFTVNILVM